MVRIKGTVSHLKYHDFESLNRTDYELAKRFFAWHGHVTLSIIKNGRDTEQMLELRRACQKYESCQVWAS